MSGPDHSDKSEIVLDNAANEQRRDPRVPVSIRVRYPQRNAFFSEYTRNISRGGMFIATDEPMQIGTRLRFALEVPGSDALLIEGEVRWAVRPEQVAGLAASAPEVEVGMGVQFVFANEAERAALEAAVREMMEDTLGPKIAAALLD